jgi:hypoxanthine phosphoribosyltransferase
VKLLFDAAQIARRVEELASEIARTMPGELTIVGLLKGSFVFVADLVRALDRAGLAPRVEFMQLQSYGCGRESSGDMRLIGAVPEGIGGRRILLVDDVADTGCSLAYARELLRSAGASEIRICALVDKPSRRKVELSPDFVGFTVGDVFVVGYGIDWAEAHRHLPCIGILD